MHQFQQIREQYPSAKVAGLTGFADAVHDHFSTWLEPALAALADFGVVFWGGDHFRTDGFTLVLRSYLRDRSNIAIAFRRSSTPEFNARFWEHWHDFKDQIVVVGAEDLYTRQQHYRRQPLPPAQVAWEALNSDDRTEFMREEANVALAAGVQPLDYNEALSYTIDRFARKCCNPSHYLSVGGGPIVLRQALTSFVSDRPVEWSVVNVRRRFEERKLTLPAWIAAQVGRVEWISLIEPLQLERGVCSDDDAADCVVCMDNKVDTLFLPCSHASVCSACAARVADCPVCRAHCPVAERAPVTQFAQTCRACKSRPTTMYCPSSHSIVSCEDCAREAGTAGAVRVYP